MKKLIICMISFLSLHVAVAGKNSAAVFKTTSDSVEVMIGVPSDNIMAYDKVRTTLTSMPGVKLLAYCSNHSVFMIYMDEAYYSSKAYFLEQVQKYAPEFAQNLNLKDGKFADIMNFCDFVNATDAATMKTKFNR